MGMQGFSSPLEPHDTQGHATDTLLRESNPKVLAGAMEPNDAQNHPHLGNRDRLYGLQHTPYDHVDADPGEAPLAQARGYNR